jgi:hypothetical protein
MARCLVAMYLQSPSGTWRCLFVLPPSLEACVFHKYASPIFAAASQIPMWRCIVFCFVRRCHQQQRYRLLQFRFSDVMLRSCGLQITEHESSGASLLRPCRLCRRGDKFLLHGVGGRQWTRLSGSCSIVWHRSCCRPAVL